MSQPAVDKKHLRLLYAGFFLMDFDLIVITPLLVPAADDMETSLGAVTLALTAYLLLFGVMQPVHGTISDSVGRMRVMRLALLGIGVGNVLATFAPNVALLITGRAVAGACAAAMVPVTIAYVGDRVVPACRQRTMANLLSAGALGAAAATVTAGTLTDVLSWRAILFLVALASAALAVLYGRLPEIITAGADRPSPLHRISQIFRGSWFRFLIIFTFVEGAVMLGFFNFFNAALQVKGNSILISGIVTSTYGVATVIGGLIVRAVSSRISSAAMFGTGSALLFVGYLVAAYTQTVVTILAASILAGLALAVAQSSIQTWAVEVAASPKVLGTTVSLIASSVFTGAAVGTVSVSGLATTGNFSLLFGIAAMITAPVMIVGAVARSRFTRSVQAV